MNFCTVPKSSEESTNFNFVGSFGVLRKIRRDLVEMCWFFVFFQTNPLLFQEDGIGGMMELKLAFHVFFSVSRQCK